MFFGRFWQRVVKSTWSIIFPIPEALASMTDNSSVILHARSVTLPGGLLLSRAVNLTLKGGFDAVFATNPGMTVIQGTMVVGKGALTVENVLLQ